MLVGKLEKTKIRNLAIRKFVVGLVSFLFFISFTSGVAHAQVLPTSPLQAGILPLTDIGLPTQDPRIIVANLIRVFLSLLGMIALILILYGGFTYMTSAGDPEKVTKAKRILSNAIIGLAIIVASYAIVAFILSQLYTAFYGGHGGVGLPGGPGGEGGTLGGGIIESHYPPRNATGIPRNTKIIITFKEKMLLSSLMDDQKTPDPADDRMNFANIKIRKTSDNASSGPFVTNVRAAVTEDQKTFVFGPLDLLGSSTEKTSYTVVLGSGIKKANGDPAFGSFGSYDWQFEVSTVVDNTPPQIDSVIPFPDSTNPRNVVVQVNFNEAIDPTTASGTVTAGKFRNITVADKAGKIVDGTYMVSNMYQTVEFVTNDLCGRNSCGDDIFCLPASADLTALVKAASVDSNPPEAKFPYDGIVDVAGNALDGNKNGKAESSPIDDYTWSFKTTDEIDLTPPKIEKTDPTKMTGNVPLDKLINTNFTKLMMFSSLNTDNVTIGGVNYWITAANIGTKSVGTINHDPLAKDTKYTPAVGSGAKDIYQNCYNPCIGP